MKPTGVTRKIDELGRIVIPKEIRRNLGIRDGENLEIFIDNENIILHKHSQIHNCEDITKKLCDTVTSVIDVDIIITDREKIVAVTNKYNELVNKKINDKLIELIDNRTMLITNDVDNLVIDNNSINGFFTIVPIISSIDSLGLVMIVSDKKNDYEKFAKLISKILSDKIDIY